jgi:glycogen debranching enzyme
LIGPFIDAWMRTHPDRPVEARKFLHGFLPHLDEACIGSISEIFDADFPYTPRGCVAQAWSVAEVLRCWVKTATAREAEHAASHLATHGAPVPGLSD